MEYYLAGKFLDYTVYGYMQKKSRNISAKVGLVYNIKL